MVKWLADIMFIVVVGFIGYVLAVAVDRKTIGQLILLVTLLMILQVSIEDLSATFKKYDERLGKIERTVDTIDRLGHGTWNWPVEGGEVTQDYKMDHHGIDIAVPSGTVVRAEKDGRVVLAEEVDIYGLAVVVDYGNGITALYAHNSKLLVEKGWPVVSETKLAQTGSTGTSTGPHLHFEIRENGVPIDPMEYLK